MTGTAAVLADRPPAFFRERDNPCAVTFLTVNDHGYWVLSRRV